MKKIIITVIIIILIALSGCIEKQQYGGNNTNAQTCYDLINDESSNSFKQEIYNTSIQECRDIEALESYRFELKEIKQKDLLQGEFSGSFLLIGGSIYGKIEEKMYLVVTYFDPRIPAYKITKLDLEKIEIHTINKNESAYFRYNSIRNPQWNYPMFNFDTKIPILYLPEGWVII